MFASKYDVTVMPKDMKERGIPLKKKKIVISAVSVLLILALVAGGTFAWFSDAEKVSADFRTGVLDVELTTNGSDKKADMDFVNLRPMGEQAFIDELTQTPDAGNKNTDGYKPDPVYFRRVDVNNVGTLPMQVLFRLTDEGPTGNKDVVNVTEVDGSIRQNADEPYVDCIKENYKLKDVLKIFVFENKGTAEKPNWVRVENVNLNEATLENGEQATYRPFTSSNSLAAGETAQFVIGGFLPGEKAGNEYQAYHFHGSLVVSADQVDKEEEEKPAVYTISGTVKDADGNALAGVKINLRNLDTVTDEAHPVTNEAGIFSAELPAGNCAIHIAKDTQQAGFYKQFVLNADKSFDIVLK